ncbi:hypothetical protein FHS89_000016 [Rubricella aquisinus]|uniref:UPF0246 protein FHS89_000016 n=1 Tax=Rubricella aquisinus TaxID=2028108 RepID=A0A840WFT2_9RHOB|nr:peroxide stress protein YaaA [Rubricella aquisinus]MBB5514018.1 hypothetical protein [Rubricella aquisinus]
MLAVLSPAKNLDFDRPADVPMTAPAFKADADALARIVAKLPVSRIKAMMELSDKLADLNWQRFQAYSDAPAQETLKQAAFAFNGDTYTGLQFPQMDRAAQDYAQDHLRILSGLYGVLRPYDAIQPYRLEMGRKVKTERGGTLYDYWGEQIADALDATAREQGAQAIVNLASIEYFGAAKEKALKTPVIHPVFQEEKSGQRKVISFFAKKARGSMARWMMEERVTDPGDLSAFDRDGYAYDPDSPAGQPHFVRVAS